MPSTAARVIDDYSSLNDTEQAEFDRRYKDLMKFRRSLNSLTKTFLANKRLEREGKEDK